MQISIRKRYAKLHLTLAAIAVIFSFLIFSLLTNTFHRYFFEKNEEFGLTDSSLNLYEDLNRNGSCERISLGKATTANIYFLQIFNDNGTMREQFNLLNPILLNAVENFDINNDNYDELFVLSKNDSLLFLSVIDVQNNEFIVKEKPIIKKTKMVTTKFWDLNDALIDFADLDNDKSYEMYLSPATGHSIYPRGLFTFDLNTFEQINYFETTAPVSKFVFHDVNKDGFDEIILRASSSGNTKNKLGIHDHTNWLIILNKDFEYVQKPFQIGEFLNGIYFDLIRYNDNEGLLFAFHNKKTKYPNDFFALMDFNFEIIRKEELPSKLRIIDLFKDEKIFSNYFYVIFGTGEVAKYDLNFEKINSIKLEKDSYRFVLIKDILKEGGLEILMQTQNSLFLLSSQLELLLKKDFESTIMNISIKSNDQNDVPQIVVNTEEMTYLFTPKINYIAEFWIPIFILITIAFYFLLLLIHRLVSRVVRVIGAYNYSYDDVNLGIIITDYLGNIKSYNKSIINNLSLDASIQKNKNIFTIFKQTSELTNVISEAFKVEKEVSRDIAFTKNDFRFIGKVQVLPLFTLFHIPHSFVIKIQNLTKEIESDRSKIWSRIAQKVAHDIKTPLSTIQLNLTALKRRISESPIADKSPLNDDIEMINEEIRQISELTKSFLKFSSLEKPNLQWTDIITLIENSIKPFKKYFDDGIKFEYEIQDDLHSVWVDPNQMVQLFHIFVENAIDAITSDGFIKITVNLVDDLQHSDNPYVEFLITDNGKGLTGEEKNKIFEPYFTQKKDGTGMGLTIAKKIVEDHGGTIDVQTKVRFGTTFIIKLPHNQPENDA